MLRRRYKVLRDFRFTKGGNIPLEPKRPKKGSGVPVNHVSYRTGHRYYDYEGGGFQLSRLTRNLLKGGWIVPFIDEPL